MNPTCRLGRAGNTLRMQGLGVGGLQGVLVVDDGEASQRWLQLWRTVSHPALLHFIDVNDWRAVGHAVEPTTWPCLLVALEGWIIDWFPLPPLDRVPRDLIALVLTGRRLTRPSSEAPRGPNHLSRYSQ